jgi:DNA repair exonuclease SbcCD ATPase subunit
VKTVLALANGDKELSEAAELLVLAAFDSDDVLQGMLDDTASTLAPTTAEKATATHGHPAAAFLESITVQGFRGIGEEARIGLRPAPGLTVIAGRNGSGKSSIAEALELALTGETHRWKNSNAARRKNWRNIHHGEPCEIRIRFAVEGQKQTTLGIDWAPGLDIEDRTTWIQRKGEKRELGGDSLGWGQLIDTFRPMLSYEELGGLLEGAPSALHDAISLILGLDQLSDADNRLQAASKLLTEPTVNARKLKAEADEQLSTSADARASDARSLLSKRNPDLKEIGKLATGATVSSSSEIARLRSLAQLIVPSKGDVDAAAAKIREATQNVADSADVVLKLLAERTELVKKALEFHEHGDAACPVCGVGTLDAQWKSNATDELQEAQKQLAGLKEARTSLSQTNSAASALIKPPPHVLSDDELGLSSLADARKAWESWATAPADGLALADHLNRANPPLQEAVSVLAKEAAEAAEAREDLWAPLAKKLLLFLNAATASESNAANLADCKEALTWVRAATVDMRKDRLLPITEQAREIWTMLRQESNVDLGAIELTGSKNQRRVELLAQVDGQEAGALSVMSQGELHALALALFLPRAAHEDSPFRFIVLDDPIQAMDPAKVDGFVKVLESLAKNRQVIVLSHDDRLPATLRQLAVGARILQVDRVNESKVSVHNADNPAQLYVSDAFALVKDEGVPDEVCRKVLPGLIRMAIEQAAFESYSERQFADGRTRTEVEGEWSEAKKTRARVALAIHGDSTKDLEGWIATRPCRRTAMGVAASGMHADAFGDLSGIVRDARDTVNDIQIGGS